MPLPLYLLAVAVFAMGTSEFMLAGLLPDIAVDLDVAIGTAGLATSSFAVGMVIGAPLTAALARRWPARSGLLGFIAVFAAAHVLGAVTTSFPVLLATRFIAAGANAGFLAVALAAATTMVRTDQKGRALAVLLSGTTIAMVAGVPGGALLGTLLDWRATFWVIAGLCVPAALGVATGFGSTTRRDGPDLRAELRQLGRPRLILVVVLGAVVNAATFSGLMFLAPIVTGTAGLGELWVPVVLVLFGIGSFVGINVAGRLSDRRPGAVVAVAAPLALAGWIGLAGFADRPVVLLVGVFVQGGLSFALGGTLIARVLYEASGAPTMGGSYATAALNIGAAGGPLLVAAGIGAGPVGPIRLSAVLIAIAVLIAVPAKRALTGANPGRLRRNGFGYRLSGPAHGGMAAGRVTTRG